MAKSKSNKNKVSYISVPSQIINSLSASSLQSLLTSPKNSCSRSKARCLSLLTKYRSPSFWVFFLFLFGILGMLKLRFNLNTLIPYSPYPRATSQFHVLVSSNGYLKSHTSIASNENGQKAEVFDSFSHSLPLIKEKEEEPKSEPNSDKAISDFWKQPDGLGYRPCLDFSRDYQKGSVVTVKDRTKYLMVVVAGGLNQQRNQIVDAVVIARILGAALVVPILQVNVIWGDESNFSDIFDMEHFKKVLANDVRIVSSLPSTHTMTRPMEKKLTPFHVSPSWIRSRYLKRIKREGVLLLGSFNSRLYKDLPSDLQKLRCKVAFHALRFVPPILGIGNKLAERMRSKGPYLALHLRMEKDVWVSTGCLPGLSHEYDEIVNSERIQRPKLLTARSNMTYHERKLAGHCPLNAVEVTRLLKALGAPKDARIYWAGGEPFGGREALLPLTREFSHFYNKEDLALPGELEPFAKRASFMAAIDYIVSENSDVFMPSHGGNMGHALQGQRAYAGHKKYITPDKRHMLPYFLDSSLPDVEFNRIIKELHNDSLGQPDIRTSKVGRDVTKYPIPECMCSDSNHKR
ncbi:hypothetical protein ABKV19_026938 [Rosa sericea]